MQGFAMATALAAMALLCGCGRQPAAPDSERLPATAVAPEAVAAGGPPRDADKVVNVYNWSDYIDPSVVPAFEKEYGIKVNYDVFDSNEVLETKLLAGRTGYDVVVPSASFLQRQIQAGVFQKLDKSLLPNLKNLDPDIMRRIEVNDPGNQYGVNYLWGTSGVGYNETQIAAAMPNAPVDSFAMFYDPNVIRNFQKCGVSILDAPDEMVGTVLLYLGRSPNSESLDDLRAAEKVLLAMRPFVRYINSSKYIEDLANGDICLALGWSGDVGQARTRALEAGKAFRIRYNVAKEGALMFFDMLAIPADAPHPNNAHLFINYLLRPEVAAKTSSSMHFTTGNAAAYPLVDPAVYNDREVYPSEQQKAHMYPNASHSMAYTRELNRTWTRFKTGH
ncbi:MAG TPA: polyamine ABC transporter substrate-binding protein [Steroidobacteraceae bacterium]|jgi:putrescine transport system substrate-binding protein